MRTVESCQLGIPIALVKLNGMVIVLWDFIVRLVTCCHAVQPELGLVSHVKELLVTFGYSIKAFPSVKIEEAIFLGIDCAGDRVISGNDG